MILQADQPKSSNTLFPYVVQRRGPTDAPFLDHRHKRQWWARHTAVVRRDYCHFLMSTKRPWTDRSRPTRHLETPLNKGCRQGRRTVLPQQRSDTLDGSRVFSDPPERCPRPRCIRKGSERKLDELDSRARRLIFIDINMCIALLCQFVFSSS